VRAVRSGFGFGCRRGSCRIGQVIVVGKHGCWPPEDYFALGSRDAAPCSRVQSKKFLAASQSGLMQGSQPFWACSTMGPLAVTSGSQLTIGRLGTKMLRSSKTLQPCKDTRRLALVSINQQSPNRPQFFSSFNSLRALAFMAAVPVRRLSSTVCFASSLRLVSRRARSANPCNAKVFTTKLRSSK
jgi:hypothetical protein